jgi:hypothetical protein
MVRVNGQEWKPGIPPGCSSPNGHYVGMYVVLTAIDAGWDNEDAPIIAGDYELNYWQEDWEWFDLWHDFITEAEAYLDSVTEGGVWQWQDGDFRLDATEECPECGEQRYADPDVRGDDDPCDGDHLWRMQ